MVRFVFNNSCGLDQISRCFFDTYKVLASFSQPYGGFPFYI